LKGLLSSFKRDMKSKINKNKKRMRERERKRGRRRLPVKEKFRGSLIFQGRSLGRLQKFKTVQN